MPRKTKMERYREERIDFAQTLAGHIISILNIKDRHSEVITYAEKAAFGVWIERGKELVSRIDASIFKE